MPYTATDAPGRGGASAEIFQEGVMKYCCECGSKVRLSRLAAEGMRYVCTGCGRVLYQSPRLAAGCIAAWEDRILLCRRAVEPGYGLWGLPSGFVETKETAAKGAARETLEEVNVAVEIERPHALFHIPHMNQMVVLFLGRLLDSRFEAGGETLEAKLFREEDVPWAELAFTTTRDALRQYFEDRRDGAFGFHFADIVPFGHEIGAAF